jgi:hypothetical protein
MKKFTLKFLLSKEGKLEITGENDGFSGFELVGLLDWKKRDIEKQIFGEIKPDVVTRKAITD